MDKPVASFSKPHNCLLLFEFLTADPGLYPLGWSEVWPEHGSPTCWPRLTKAGLSYVKDFYNFPISFNSHGPACTPEFLWLLRCFRFLFLKSSTSALLAILFGSQVDPHGFFVFGSIPAHWIKYFPLVSCNMATASHSFFWSRFFILKGGISWGLLVDCRTRFVYFECSISSGEYATPQPFRELPSEYSKPL